MVLIAAQRIIASEMAGSRS